MSDLFEKLYRHDYLNMSEADRLLTDISHGHYNAAQIASVLTVFIMRPIQVNELRGFQNALLNLAVPCNLEPSNTIDVCGTGGDGKNSFNISTSAAFVIAGAGYKVTKHGNYGVSSLCGSSNVLEFLGFRFTNNTDILNTQLDQASICFLHAPLFHPAMKAVAPIRKSMGVRTFFNMLGPLVNPVQPIRQLTGVYSLELARLYDAIQSSKEVNYTVVHSLDGYDEISLTGPVKYFSSRGEGVHYPDELNMATIQQSDIYGGATVEESAEILLSVLENKSTTAQKNVVIANAAMGIRCFDFKKDFSVCIDEARYSIESGKAKDSFLKMREIKR